MNSMSSTFNVPLFWIVTGCGVFGAFVPLFVKLLIQFITRETEMESNLRRQACDLKAELGTISMVDEFAKYAKIKRKVSKVTDELSHQSDIKSSYTLKLRLFITAGLYTTMSLTVMYLLWNYSKTPVANLPEEWLYPLSSVLSYPSGIPGAISLTAWLFISSTTGKLLATCIHM